MQPFFVESNGVYQLSSIILAAFVLSGYYPDVMDIAIREFQPSCEDSCTTLLHL